MLRDIGFFFAQQMEIWSEFMLLQIFIRRCYNKRSAEKVRERERAACRCKTEVSSVLMSSSQPSCIVQVWRGLLSATQRTE
jgi:hypothetical protein